MDTTQFEFELSLKTDFHRDQRAHVAILKLMCPTVSLHAKYSCKKAGYYETVHKLNPRKTIVSFYSFVFSLYVIRPLSL